MMRIVAQLTAGNSIEVLDGCIEHHRQAGIDAFVILHVYSEDGTPDRIRELAATRSGIEAVFCSVPDGVFGIAHDRTLEIAREKLGADWIVQIDADERWIFRDGGFHDLCDTVAAGLTVPRFQTVWPDPDGAAAAGLKPVSPDRLPIAAYPVKVSHTDFESLGLPFVLTRIGPKCLLRAASQHRFSMGGHHAVGPNGEGVAEVRPPGVLIAQLPFSSLERFTRKGAFAAHCVREYGSCFDETIGWHWRRWARIYQQGTDALRAEWQRQFLTPGEARQLVGRDVIVNADCIFEMEAPA
jgi:hypothetical protein